MSEYKQTELLAFLRNGYVSPTPMIKEVCEKALRLVRSNSRGALIYGKSNRGKSTGIDFITKKLKAEYGDKIGIAVHTATKHKVCSQKTFYSAMLDTFGVKILNTRYTAEALRQMLIRRIIALASMHPEHRFVLFIDEVSFMQEDEFYWLVDVCNALIRGHVVLTVFLVGMDESLNLFELFKNFDQMQVVNRFMRTQIEFPGIKGFKGLQDTLNSFDSSFVFKDSNVVLFREFFPEMYREGGSLVDCSQDILDAFNEACAEISSPIAEISMGVLTQAIVDCCCTYGKYGKGLIRPGFKEWKDCISLSLGNSPMIM